MGIITTELESPKMVVSSEFPRFHRHSFFGTQQLSVESYLAFDEGLISESEFESVRQTFFRAQKIRAYYDFGGMSHEEFQTHRDQFAAELLALPDLAGKRIFDIAFRNSSFSRQHQEVNVPVEARGESRGVARDTFNPTPNPVPNSTVTHTDYTPKSRGESKGVVRGADRGTPMTPRGEWNGQSRDGVGGSIVPPTPTPAPAPRGEDEGYADTVLEISSSSRETDLEGNSELKSNLQLHSRRNSNGEKSIVGGTCNFQYSLQTLVMAGSRKRKTNASLYPSSRPYDMIMAWEMNHLSQEQTLPEYLRSNRLLKSSSVKSQQVDSPFRRVDSWNQGQKMKNDNDSSNSPNGIGTPKIKNTIPVSARSEIPNNKNNDNLGNQNHATQQQTQEEISKVKRPSVTNQEEQAKVPKYNVIGERPVSPSPAQLNKPLKSSENIMNFLQQRKSVPRQVSKLQWDHEGDQDVAMSEEQNMVDDFDIQDAQVEDDFESGFETASEGASSAIRSERSHGNRKDIVNISPEPSEAGGESRRQRSRSVTPPPRNLTPTRLQHSQSQLTTRNLAAISTRSQSDFIKATVPNNVPDYGAKRILEKRKSNFTGMELTEAALNLYQHMRIEHEYKWVTYELNPMEKTINISNSGGKDATYQSFLEAFPPVRCCYAVYLFQVYKRGEQQWKPVFVNWCPDGAPVKQRMIYASNKDFFKSFLDGLALELQATDVDDLKEEDIKAQVSRLAK